MDKVYVGTELYNCADIHKELNNAVENKFDFMAIPLVHPRNRRDDVGISSRRLEPLTRSDKMLGSDKWTTSIVGKVSDWIRLDSRNENVRKSSEKAFEEEMRWATHLSVPAIWIGTPSYDCANFARNLGNMIPKNGHSKIWVEVPLVKSSVMLCEEDEEMTSIRREDDPWEAWNNLRTYCEHHPSIGVALVITENLPDDYNQAIKRWRGEPIMALVIPTSIFVTNASGYPTLSLAHQRCVLSLMDLKAQIVIRGKSRHPEGLVCIVRLFLLGIYSFMLLVRHLNKSHVVCSNT